MNMKLKKEMKREGKAKEKFVGKKSNIKFIPIAGPWITSYEVKKVCSAVKNAWYGGAYRYQKEFEEKFSKYIGRKYSLSTSSCTNAIHLALLSLGIGPGDEVIVPDITWVATAEPVIYVGATPIFADISPDTWCISPESVEENITPRTKAIIVVDLYGGMPDMDKILNIAKKHGIFVIEDAAEAFGSEYKGKKAGSFGDISVFSFHGTKTITTGEGGMLLTDSEKIYEKAKKLRDHGKSKEKIFWCDEIGYKYMMSDLQAALGIAQLERAEKIIEKKIKIFRWYEEFLSGVDGIKLNPSLPYVKNSYWMVTAIIDGVDKEILISRLADYGVSSRPFFYPLSSQPSFRDLPTAEVGRKKNRVSYQLSKFGINLPSALCLNKEDVKYVCQTLLNVVEDLRRERKKL